MTHSKANAQLNYLAPSVASSLFRNGKVFTHRDVFGNDDSHHGVIMEQRDIIINDARLLEPSASRRFDLHGFELQHQPLQFSSQQFFDQRQVVQGYYPECTEIVRKGTNASQVFAFDHNVRCPAGKDSDKRIAHGEQQVQGPIHYVHGDYTLTSAPQRLRDLAKPPGVNDTLRAVLDEGESLLTSEIVSQTLNEGKRFELINVWRNIDHLPVMSDPLALCDGHSMSIDDLVVFEIHYHDRIGENYFAKYSPAHQWWYYPLMTRDEIILIKQWDSSAGLGQADGDENNNAPCTFSFHSAFKDLNTPANALERKSIEVRCIAFFD